MVPATPMTDDGEHDARRRRWPLLLLAVGAVAAAVLFLSGSPHQHAIELRVAKPGTVRGLQLSWRDGAGELLRSRELRFGDGGAPRRIDASLTAADGRVELVVQVERAGVPPRTHRRRLRLERGQGAMVVPIGQ